jgi:uncharacterized membrane protein YeaQ/YmgE (transglycosylase-associated protein family)
MKVQGRIEATQICGRQKGFPSMTVLGLTITFSDLALEFIVGAIAAGLTGRAMRGGGFGLVGDLIFGIVGAIVASFTVVHFGLFSITTLLGELIVAAIGAILLVVIVHLVTTNRTIKA